ncbi:MAG: hypothetical protein IT365_19910 [Candidatus Hydrogenedentes bacterium]|nr:hypothetical protein [Candidatus Hydrogenedentota bacterium]
MIWKRRKQTGKRRDTWFSGAGCAAAGGVLFLIGLCLYLALGHILVRSTEKKVARLEQQIRDAGQPLTLEEWDAYYPAVPDEENAALIYQQAFVQLEEADPRGEIGAALDARLWAVRREDESLPSLRGEMAAFLVECEEACALLDTAATMAKARHSLDHDTFDASYHDRQRQLLACARLETIRAADEILEGRQDQFVKRQESIIRIGDSLREEPISSSLAVRAAIRVVQLKCVATGLNLAYLYPETLTDLEKFYQEPNDSGLVVRSLAGDRCLLLARHSGPGHIGDRSLMDRALNYFDPVGQSAFRRIKSNSQCCALMEEFAQLIRLADKPHAGQIAYIADLRANGKGWEKWVERPDHPLCVPLRNIERMALNPLAARLGRLIIAIERYRSDYEELPGSFKQLVPDYILEIPLDPYDGQPMRYVTKDQDYMLYSVYFDRVDDGGAPLEKSDESEWKGDWRISIVQ